MATLKNLRTGQLRPLPARLLIGRTAACSLRLDDPVVSGEHASLIWTGKGWEIRDLGSRNGTFVDGSRVSAGDPAPIAAGARLGFGHAEGRWELADAGPPGALAEAVGDDAVRTAIDGLLALPDAAEPAVVVYADRTGAWMVEEADQGARPIADLDVVQAGGRSWRVRVPGRLEGTATVDVGPSIDTVRLRFAVSRDEEHVELTVLHRGREIRLEPREHAYTLLTLARARIGDSGQPLSEQGWLERDRLLRMLGVDSNSLNVAIYRARGQLSEAGIDGAAALVEVRRGQRRIGLEPDRMEIVPL